MSTSSEEQEAELVRRLLAIQTGAAGPSAAGGSGGAAVKQAWYGDAYSFLQSHGGQHWWCHHGDVTAGGEASRQHRPPHVPQVWLSEIATALAASSAAGPPCRSSPPPRWNT